MARMRVRTSEVETLHDPLQGRQVLECGDGVFTVTALALAVLETPKSATNTATPPQSGDSADSVAAVQDAQAPTQKHEARAQFEAFSSFAAPGANGSIAAAGPSSDSSPWLRRGPCVLFCKRSQMRTIYFDYNSTTPLDPQVRDAMLPFLGDLYGNPSSIHHVGRKARAILDEAHERVARVWQCRPSEVVFTSGGTESNNLAVFGVARLLRSRGRHLITTWVEHHSVLHCFERLGELEGFDITYLPVDRAGRVDPGDLLKSIRADTIFVSVMAANNEVGTLQPVAEIGSLCRARGIVFHTDAAQWLGKQAFTSIHQFNADLVSACAHKFHGPKGSGALFIRSPLQPRPLILGGGHENERRAGTENLAAIIGFTEATERFVTTPVFPSERLLSLRQPLIHLCETLAGVVLCTPRQSSLANTLAFTAEGCDSLSLLAALDLAGICASSGSACSAGSLETSHVLLAMGVEPALAKTLIRFSLGRENTAAEVAHVVSVLPAIIQQIRSS